MVDTAAYRQAVLVSTRKHNRWDEDGLPSPPSDAPLPVGDPSSGLYTMTREDIRAALLPLPDMVDAADAAATAAEAASDLAQGYAEVAVAASNVPIYPTRAFVTTFAVPAGINSFRTDGYASSGDGGGGFYVADAVPGPGGIVDDTAGTARTFRLAVREVAPAMFGGNLTDMNAYIAALGLTSPQVFSPAVHLFAPLTISRFKTKGGPFDAQTMQLQNAITALITDSRYQDLDLDGRCLTTEDTVVWDSAGVSSSFRYPLTIKNGTILASGSVWGATDKPILKIFDSSGARFGDAHFTNVTFRGATGDLGFSSGVYIEGSYLGIRFRQCNFRNMAKYCIRTRQLGGFAGDLNVEQCQLISAHPLTMPFADRTCIALDLDTDGDGKILRNRYVANRHWLRGAIGSYLVQGNHGFQGLSGITTPQGGFNAGILVGSRPNSIFSGNYIDNGHIQFEEGLNGEVSASSHGFCVISNNIFTMANSGPNEKFVVFRPTTTGMILQNLLISQNQFRVIGDYKDTMTIPFWVSGFRGGSLNNAAARNVHVKDNYFWGDMVGQSTEITRWAFTNATTTAYDVDLTGATAFGLKPDLTAIGPRFSSSSPGSVWFDQTGDFVGKVRLGTAQAGKVRLVFDCNTTVAA